MPMLHSTCLSQDSRFVERLTGFHVRSPVVVLNPKGSFEDDILAMIGILHHTLPPGERGQGMETFASPAQDITGIGQATDC